MHLLQESIIIGIVFVILFAIVHSLFMYKNSVAAMKHESLFLQTFITAGLFHILADIFGLNDKYCSSK